MKQQPIKRRPGRPPVERRRVPMGLRVTPELRDQLVARAEKTGRSITQEMELLLEQALFMQWLREHPSALIENACETELGKPVGKAWQNVDEAAT